MEDANNPYTAMEGYAVYDASGDEIGRVSDTVYDDVSDVLKYVVVDGHVVLANGIHVDPDEERVTVPYDAEAVGSAPAFEEVTGAFDRAVREHYEDSA